MCVIEWGWPLHRKIQGDIIYGIILSELFNHFGGGCKPDSPSSRLGLGEVTAY